MNAKLLRGLPVYVASSFRHRARAAKVIALMKKLGAKITCDWTAQKGRCESERCKRFWAVKDLEGVRNAKLVVLLRPSNTRGKHVEMGGALILGIPVVVVGGSRCPKDLVFYHHPGIVAWVNGVLGLIKLMETAGAATAKEWEEQGTFQPQIFRWRGLRTKAGITQ